MKRKVWLAIVLIVSTVAIAAIWMTYFLYDKLYIEKQIDALMRYGESLQHAYENQSWNAFFERLQWTEEMTEATVLFTENPMQLGSAIPLIPDSDEDLITFEERQQLLRGEAVVMIRSHPHFNQNVLGIAVPLFSRDELSGAILLTMPLSEVEEPFKNIGPYLLVAILFVIVIILFIGNRVINYLVKPLEAMKDGAMTMASGDFSMRIDDWNRNDELGELARSFNALAISLEKVEENRREFLANVSHELRTPLSYMKGYVEAIEEGVIDDQEAMKIIKHEISRLERLVHDLLDLAQLEGDSYPLKREPVAFAQLIDDVIETMKWLAEKKEIELHRELDEQIIVYGDRDRLEQVVRNLLDNAIKFTPSRKKVVVTLEAERAFAKLTVADEGIGIPENELNAVTERFYRVDKARSRKTGGTGLGLAIVKEIIKKHGGELKLSSKLGKGTKATVLLERL